MKLDDLNLNELLEFDQRGGVIHFAGRRALLMDAEALGLLRTELISTLGATAARTILTRFGWVHGWRTAEGIKGEFPWDSEADWRRAGGRLHTLQGLVLVEPAGTPPGAPHAPFAESVWRESYEAEQHLLHLGRSNVPVCWTLCGFASGYLSHATGREVFFFEERCVGRGDATCRVVGRFREEWTGPEAEDLGYYKAGCLEAAVQQVTDTLKKTEQKLRRRRTELARTAPDDDPSGIVARSEVMQKLLATARRIAKVDSTVLVIGESGAGKERLSRLIHDESARAGGPFVAVNCAAVSETLLESELFGHVKGAFTGATSDRAGLFEAANGGTLFLDEVGEIPPAMQAKLLRVIQEREVRRVGENRSRKVEVRLVAATNRDLTDDVAQGRFRKDLYYRLRVVELKLPSLRERKDDVLPLAQLLLAQAAARMARRISGLTPKAADQLLRHDWPGNVRELENAMERAAALADSDRIGLDDLPEEIRAAPPTTVASRGVRPLDDIEREYILAALDANDGNQTRTASQLGIGTATLYRKLKQYQRDAAVPP
jgi:DNA-binding NtrC family response regulator